MRATSASVCHADAVVEDPDLMTANDLHNLARGG